MDSGERLAAYLSGDLDASEHAALEAELARDPVLRARLELQRRTDDALAALPSPTVPADASARLRAAVSAAITTEDDGSTAVAGPAEREAAVATLASARERRQRRRWQLAGGIAAGVVALVAVGVGLSALGGSSDESASSATDAGAEQFSQETAADGAAAEPLIVVSDRDYDEAALQALAAEPRFTDVANDEVNKDAAADLQSQRLNSDAAGQSAQGETTEAASASESAPASDTTGSEAASGGAPGLATAPGDTTLRDGSALSFNSAVRDQAVARGVDPSVIATAERCLPDLLTGDDPRVPLYVESARFQGQDAIIYALAAPDPVTGGYGRVEVIAVSAQDCFPLFFTQRDQS